MLLFVGLGNPGREYAGHRHNIGFMAVDALARACDAGPWRKKFQGDIAEARLGTERAILLKPQTYMNESGRSVAEAARFHKIELDRDFRLPRRTRSRAGKNAGQDRGRRRRA